MKKYVWGMVLLVAAISLVAFIVPINSNLTETVTFQYVFNGEEGIGEVSNWTDVTESGPSECNPGSDLPCVVIYSTSEFEPIGNDRGIANFLAAHPTASSIMLSDYLDELKGVNP